MQKMKIIKIIITILLIICLTAFVGCSGSASIQEADKPQIPVTELEVKQLDSSELGESLISVNGFIYYLKDEEFVYKAPIDDPGAAEVVYQWSGTYVYSYLRAGDDMAIFNFRTEGASLGSSRATVIFADNSTKQFDCEVFKYIKGDNHDVVIGYAYGMGKEWPLFEVCMNNEDEFRPIGEENYIYGMYRVEDEGGNSFSVKAPELVIVDDDAYIIAYHYTISGESAIFDPPGIYKVNVKTGKTERVIDEPVFHFKANDESIFFVGEDKLLCRIKIGENKPEKVSDMQMEAFFVLRSDEHLMSGLAFDSGLNEYANIVDDYLITKKYIFDTQTWQGIVIDKAGNVYKSDPAHNIEFITVYDGVIWEFI